MAKKSGPNTAGPDVLPEFNPEPGMNFDQWSRDRAGFRTNEEMVTGGMSAMMGEFSSCEVGENYPDGMSEERSAITWPGANPMHTVTNPPGRLGASGSVSPGSYGKKGDTGFGKSTLRAPQNYRIP